MSGRWSSSGFFRRPCRSWFRRGHVAHFIRELVREQLDLSAIFAVYDEERGAPPFHPAMMTSLLLYAYTQGVYSSRRISRACEVRLDFMAVTAMQKLDFRPISEFRRRHLSALEGLFKQVLTRRARRESTRTNPSSRARWWRACGADDIEVAIGCGSKSSSP